MLVLNTRGGNAQTLIYIENMSCFKFKLTFKLQKCMFFNWTMNYIADRLWTTIDNLLSDMTFVKLLSVSTLICLNSWAVKITFHTRFLNVRYSQNYLERSSIRITFEVNWGLTDCKLGFNLNYCQILGTILVLLANQEMFTNCRWHWYFI